MPKTLNDPYRSIDKKAVTFVHIGVLRFKDLQIRFIIFRLYSCNRMKRYPYKIRTIEMWVFRTEKKYLKSASRLLDRDYINRGG